MKQKIVLIESKIVFNRRYNDLHKLNSFGEWKYNKKTT